MVGFSRATYDIVFGDRPMQLYVATEPMALEQLLERLGVMVGTGGGVISLGRNRPSATDRYPSDLLVDIETKKFVGLVPKDFDTTGKFGLCLDRTEAVAKALTFARPLGEPITYENSHLLYDY